MIPTTWSLMAEIVEPIGWIITFPHAIIGNRSHQIYAIEQPITNTDGNLTDIVCDLYVDGQLCATSTPGADTGRNKPDGARIWLFTFHPSVLIQSPLYGGQYRHLDGRHADLHAAKP